MIIFYTFLGFIIFYNLLIYLLNLLIFTFFLLTDAFKDLNFPSITALPASICFIYLFIFSYVLICSILIFPFHSLVAQLVKNPPAMQETWVRSLCWEDPLEERKATHSSILAWRIPWTV